jgi:hypothetical protein
MVTGRGRLGVTLASLRASPDEAHRDAERFLDAVLSLEYEEQRGCEVQAVGVLDADQKTVGWRGGVNLTRIHRREALSGSRGRRYWLIPL